MQFTYWWLLSNCYNTSKRRIGELALFCVFSYDSKINLIQPKPCPQNFLSVAFQGGGRRKSWWGSLHGNRISETLDIFYRVILLQKWNLNFGIHFPTLFQGFLPYLLWQGHRKTFPSFLEILPNDLALTELSPDLLPAFLLPGMLQKGWSIFPCHQLSTTLIVIARC